MHTANSLTHSSQDVGALLNSPKLLVQSELPTSAKLEPALIAEHDMTNTRLSLLLVATCDCV
jgi:hypothetical protein